MPLPVPGFMWTTVRTFVKPVSFVFLCQLMYDLFCLQLFLLAEIILQQTY